MVLFFRLMKTRLAARICLFPFLFSILVFVACGTVSKGPAIKPNESRIDIVQEILLKNHSKFKTLQGRGKLVIQSPRQSFSGSAVVNLKNPDSIYVRVEAVFGLDVGVVFADLKRFLIYSPMENLAYVGDNTDTLRLKSFLGFDLTFEEMMHSMSGLTMLKKMPTAKIKMKEDELHIIGLADSVFYDYTLDTQFGLISQVVMKDFNGRTLRIEEYKQFTTINGVRVPRLVRFTRPIEKESLTIFYDQLAINKSISAADFYVRVPNDALKIRL